MLSGYDLGMKHFNRRTSLGLVVVLAATGGGYVAGQQSDSLGSTLSRALYATPREGEKPYLDSIQSAAKDPSQVSEVVRVAFSFPQHAPRVLQSLQVEQNAVLIEQNKRIIELLEGQSKK